MRRLAFAFVALISAVCAGALLQTTASLTGRAVSADGAALPGVSVEARNTSTGRTYSDVTNAAGRFRFPLLDPGQYHVTASLQGFETQSKNVGVTVGQSQEVVFEFGPVPIAPPPTGTIDGHVQSQSGAALANASLVFVPGRGGDRATAKTNPSGDYSRGYLVVDTYEVTCSAPDYVSMTKSIRVVKDSAVRLDFKLAKQ